MLILGLDFETTGLDVEKDDIIEVGAVIWDTEAHAPKMLLSDMVHTERPLTEEITKITGITREDLHDFAKPPLEVFTKLEDMLKSCNVVAAHNGKLFDKPLYEANLKRLGLTTTPRLWIDTTTDISFHEKIKTRKLTHLAAEHGFLNPFAHRALFDVLTMLKIIDWYNAEEICELAKQPTIVIKALVSYDDREQAKERGYRWNGEKKEWIKSIKAGQLDNEIAMAPFKVLQIQSEISA